jgi:hypothetical protein
MNAVADFIYYVLLKGGKILVLILGTILFIMIVVYFQNWQTGFEQITTNSVKTCQDSSDCFYWCDECVSIASTQVCKSPYKPCECVENLCQPAS